MESTHLDWCGLGNRRRRLTGRSNGRALEPGGSALTFGSLGKERKRRPESRRAARRPFDWIQRASHSWAKGSHLRPIAGGASMEYHVAGPHGHKQILEIQGGPWPLLALLMLRQCVGCCVAMNGSDAVCPEKDVDRWISLLLLLLLSTVIYRHRLVLRSDAGAMFTAERTNGPPSSRIVFSVQV